MHEPLQEPINLDDANLQNGNANNVNLRRENPNSLSESVNFDDGVADAVLYYIGSLHDSGNFTETQTVMEGHSQLLGGGFLRILKVL